MKLDDMIDIYGYEKIIVEDVGTHTSYHMTGDYFQSVASIVRSSVPPAILEKEINFCSAELDDLDITFIIYLKEN